MFQWLFRRIRQKACQQLIVELFRYDEVNHCWDPIGSVDHRGIVKTIQDISTERIADSTKVSARSLFKKVDRQHVNIIPAELRSARKGKL